MKSRAYLDYAATTPLDKRVLKAMQPYLTTEYANPSSLHAEGRQQRAALEDARKRIAKVLGAKPAEIVFTSGSTEAANIAIGGIAKAIPMGRIVASTIEHEAVLKTVVGYQAKGTQPGVITVGESGVVAVEQVANAITDYTVLICVQYANNEIGTIQPIADIAQLIQQVRIEREMRGIQLPLYLYCDAAQAGLLNLQVARLGVDLLSMGGSKLYGPTGSGFLYIRTGVTLKPVLFGGGQENGLRSGTESVTAAVGVATALEIVQADRADESKRLAELRGWLWKEIERSVEGAHINGSTKSRLPHNLNITIPGASGETLVAYLDTEGFAVATGSACTAANQDPSHVLLAIGHSASDAESSLRITLGRETTKTQVQAFAKTLAAVVPRVRHLSATA